MSHAPAQLIFMIIMLAYSHLTCLTLITTKYCTSKNLQLFMYKLLSKSVQNYFKNTAYTYVPATTFITNFIIIDIETENEESGL